MAFRKNAFRKLNFWGRSIRYAPSRREAYAAEVDYRYDDVLVRYDEKYYNMITGFVDFDYPKIRGSRSANNIPTNWDDIPAGDFKRKSWKNRRYFQYNTHDGETCGWCGRYIKTQQSFGDHDGCQAKDFRQRVRKNSWQSRQLKYLLTKVVCHGRIEKICKHCLGGQQGRLQDGYLRILEQDNG